MNNEKTILALNQDITKLKKQLKEATLKNKYQEKVIFNQSKMAAMGEMISMIAHQWKQPLNCVSILVQEIFFNLKINNLENSVDVTLKKDIEEQLNYMAHTINDFKDFYKKDKIKNNINMVKLIDSILKLVSGQLKNNKIIIKIKFGTQGKHIQYDEKILTLKELFDKDYLVTTYSNELKQVILNIISNSKDALVESVSLPKIRTINIILNRKNKQSIEVIIEDNGGGIKDKDELNKIWEPHFTTKDQGTGIGLYISKIIVEKNLHSSIEAKNGNFGLQTKLTIHNI